MHALIASYAEQALVNALMSKKAPLMRKNKFGLGLMVLSGLLFLVAVAFGIGAAHFWFLSILPAVEAILLTSACVFALCALSGLTAYLLLKKKPQPPQTPSLEAIEIQQAVSQLGELFGDELGASIQENPKTALILAGVAGFVAGDYLR